VVVCVCVGARVPCGVGTRWVEVGARAGDATRNRCSEELGPAKAAEIRRKKGFKWTSELEQTLRTLHEKHAASGHDALEKITDEFKELHPIAVDRKESSIRAKLSKMKLPIASPAEWTEDELQELRVAYGQLVDGGHEDPLQAIVDSEQFASKKTTAARLRNQLKKLGVVVAPKHKKRVVVPWEEIEIMALKESHDEFKEIFRGIKDIVDAIADDPRMEDRSKADIKKKLQELGLIKSFAKKKKDVVETREAAPARWTIGELDQDFAMNLHAKCMAIRDQGDDSVEQIAWLVQQMKAQIEKVKESDATAAGGDHALLPADMEDAKCLRPLVGMMGFLKASDSDSDDSDDEEDAKAPQWAIPTGLPLARLTAMEQVLSMETLDMDIVTADAEAEVASKGARAAGDDDGGSDGDGSDSDDDSDDDEPPALADQEGKEGEADEIRKKELQKAAKAARARQKAMAALIEKRKDGKKTSRRHRALGTQAEVDAAEQESGWQDESEAQAATQGSAKRRRLRALDSSDEEDNEDEGDDSAPASDPPSLNYDGDSAAQADSTPAGDDSGLSQATASSSPDKATQDGGNTDTAAPSQPRRSSQLAKRAIMDSDDEDSDDEQAETSKPAAAESAAEGSSKAASVHATKRRRVVAIESDSDHSDSDEEEQETAVPEVAESESAEQNEQRMTDATAAGSNALESDSASAAAADTSDEAAASTAQVQEAEAQAETAATDAEPAMDVLPSHMDELPSPTLPPATLVSEAEPTATPLDTASVDTAAK